MKQIGLVLRPERDLSDAVNEICAWASSAGVLLVGPEAEPRLAPEVPRRPNESLAEGCDAVLALGVDGTMLGALRLAAPHRVPVLGVNLGTLGYLTEVDSDHLGRALAALARGEFEVESRTGLALSAPGVVAPQIAYNDVVLTRVPGRGQAALGLSIDGELLVRYASDGVIVATPQGSTAYAFAAGGPLVSPRASTMIVMPDAPHGLFNRAVVLSESEKLGIKILSRSAPVSIERDGRLLGHAEAGTTFEVRAEPDAAWVICGRARRIRPAGPPQAGHHRPRRAGRLRSRRSRAIAPRHERGSGRLTRSRSPA